MNYEARSKNSELLTLNSRLFPSASGCIILVSLVIRLILAFMPMDAITWRIMPDDAFYYFTIARNIATGNGFSFDGINPSNGYHPLWMAVITPIFYCLSGFGLIAPIRASLIVSSLLDCLTGYVLYVFVCRVSKDKRAGLIAAGLYLLNPYSILQSLSGMEYSLVSLSAALFVLFFSTALKENTAKTAPAKTAPAKYWLLTSLAMAMAVLARTDAIILVPIVLVYLILKPKYRKEWKTLATVCLIPGLALFLWFAVSYATTGELTQSSGAAAPLTQHNIFLRASGGTYLTIGLPVHLGRLAIVGIKQILIYNPLFMVLLLCCAVYRKEAIKIPEAVKVLLVFSALLFMVHWFIRWTPRPWYGGNFNVGIAAALGFMYGRQKLSRQKLSKSKSFKPARSLITETSCATSRSQRLIYVFLRAIRSRSAELSILETLCATSSCLLFMGSFAYSLLHGMYPAQKGLYEGALAVKSHFKASAVLGASDCGVTGYFSERTVINLDGVVNSDALDSMKNGTLLNYIISQKIEYISLNKELMRTEYMGQLEAGHNVFGPEAPAGWQSIARRTHR